MLMKEEKNINQTNTRTQTNSQATKCWRRKILD